MSPADSAILDSDQPEPDSLPLRWLLERGDLGLVAHHLPDPDLPVGWAHAIELDDPSPWLQGTGLVLTTGLRLPRTKHGQEEYVARLAAAGAGALGLGTGLRFAAVPFAISAACRHHGLALVEVPLPTPFLAIEQAVTDRLAELRRLRLRESLRAQQRVTRAAVGEAPGGVVAELARVLRAGVLALSVDGVPLARAGSPAPEADEVVAEASRGGAVRVAAPGRVLEIQPLGADPGDPLGWLAVARAEPFTTAERLVLAHAVGILTLELARPPSPGSAGPADAALEAVVSGRPLAAWELLRAHGLDHTEPLCLVGVAAPDPAVLDRCLASAARQRPLLSRPWGEGRYVALVAASSVDPLLAALPGAVAAVAGAPTLADALPATLGPVLQRLAGAAPGERLRLEDDPVARVTADPAVAEAVGPWLTALREYDAAHEAELVRTLAAYLRHHGAWDPAASALGVHRHTVRHRVERAAAVAGFDLADARHRALLTLALG